MFLRFVWNGFVACGLLNILAAAAALAVALRAKLTGRAEVAVATAMIWNFLVMVPVYALGFTQHLDARTLAIVSVPWFVFALLICRDGASWREYARNLGGGARGLAMLPIDGIVLAFRSRSLVLVGLVFTACMLVWTAYCAYLSPSWRQWDALWYHEPMIGFAIQNHGFAIVPLSEGAHQHINSYPRLSEMTQLWFVIFTDRRLVDIANHVMAPSLILGVYVLTRRFSSDPLACMAWGCTLVLMPACAGLLGSTYVDPHNASFVVAGAYFCTRPLLRLSDTWLAAICLTMAVGSKTMALVPVGAFGLIALGRVCYLHFRARPRATSLTVLGGGSLILSMMASIYVRNWVVFHNPFWPDLKYDNDKLGIHWPGITPWGSNQYEQGINRIDMNLPVGEFLGYLARIPYSVRQGHYTEAYDFGVGIIWVVFPLALVAFVALAAVALRAVLGHPFGIASRRMSPLTVNALMLAIPLAAMLYTSPALWASRYQIGSIALMMALVAWLGERSEFAGIKGASTAAVLLAIVAFFWTAPRWWLWPDEAKALAAIPYPEREVSPKATFSTAPELTIASGSATTREGGLAREKELTAGTMVAIPSNAGSFIALYWNNDFSNYVVWFPDGPDQFDRIAASGAKWAYAGLYDPLHARLAAKDSGWETVGTLNVENFGTVFRRKLP